MTRLEPAGEIADVGFHISETLWIAVDLVTWRLVEKSEGIQCTSRWGAIVQGQSKYVHGSRSRMKVISLEHVGSSAIATPTSSRAGLGSLPGRVVRDDLAKSLGIGLVAPALRVARNPRRFVAAGQRLVELTGLHQRLREQR